ncbi:hypothetical protein M9458_012777, partial [Cirrhinus mrigala]
TALHEEELSSVSDGDDELQTRLRVTLKRLRFIRVVFSVFVSHELVQTQRFCAYSVLILMEVC